MGQLPRVVACACRVPGALTWHVEADPQIESAHQGEATT